MQAWDNTPPFVVWWEMWMRIWAGLLIGTILSGCAGTLPVAPPSVMQPSPDAATVAAALPNVIQPTPAPLAPTPAPPAPTPASLVKTPQEIAKFTFPSVVLLVMTNSRGEEFSQGSGFFVREGVIATNFHVIEGAISGYAKVIGTEQKFIIDGVVGADKANDLALVKISGSTAPALPLGTQPSVGDDAFAIGNPRGLEGTFSQGIVSSLRNDSSGALVQITAPISPGSSGGPVVNNEGKVIGVATATLRDSQNLNFAVPVAQVEKLMSGMTALKSLAEINGASAVTENAPISNSYAKYENQAFSFSYPSSWQLDEFPAKDTLLRLTGPKGEGVFAIHWRMADLSLSSFAQAEVVASGSSTGSLKPSMVGGKSAYFYASNTITSTGLGGVTQGVIAGGLFYRLSTFWNLNDKTGSQWFATEMDKLVSSWTWK